MSAAPSPRKRQPARRLPPPPAPPRAVLEVAERVLRALEALAEVHTESGVAPGRCRECLVTFPCHTRVMVDEALEAMRS